jgi:hypothetical protein
MVLQVMYRMALLVAAAIGSAGVFLLWASFHVPELTLPAVLHLAVAAAITLATPQAK